MEDIKKAIEKEKSFYRQKVYQERIIDSNSYFDSVDIALAVKHGAEFILSKWQEAERWRKVEEELPTCEDDLVIVKVRNKNKEDGIFLYDICYIDEETKTWGKRHHTWEDIIEWKPIH